MTGIELKNPPVVEASLAIQFSDLSDWSPLHHGLFYGTIKDRFPVYHARDTFPAIAETFPLVQRQGVLQFTKAIPECRAEFASDDESMLVSIQRNRFSFHWKNSRDRLYPRFETNSSICEREYISFLEFCKLQEFDHVKPVLCEVMYMNHIQPNEGESLSELCEKVFTLSLGEFEAITANRTYVLGDNQGRLYAEINGHPGGESRISFKLTSRVRHTEGDAMNTITKSHDWLIEKFCELTTDTVRKERWQQK